MDKYVYKTFYKGLAIDFKVHSKGDFFIILPGFPSSNNYTELINFLYNKGFSVISIKYPGSFESDGSFLDSSSSAIVEKGLNAIKTDSFLDLWGNRKITFKSRRINILTGSFGGLIATEYISKNNFEGNVILSAPLLNIKIQKQMLKQTIEFVKRAFKYTYRINKNWEKQFLDKESILFPVNNKLIVLHDLNDATIPFKDNKRIYQTWKTKNDLSIIFHNKGHGPLNEIIMSNWNKIFKKMT